MAASSAAAAARAPWGPNPWSRRERDLWNKVLARLRELAAARPGPAPTKEAREAQPAAAGGVIGAAALAPAGTLGHEFEEDPANLEVSLKTFLCIPRPRAICFPRLKMNSDVRPKGELERQLDILASLTLPNPAIGARDAGSMVAALAMVSLNACPV